MGASSVTGVSGYGIVAGVQRNSEHISLGVERLIGPRHVYVGNNVISSANSSQTITLTGSPTGGTFTLTYSGQTTSGLAYNALASSIQTALQGLSSIGVGNIAVTGSAGGPYAINFLNGNHVGSTRQASPISFFPSPFWGNSSTNSYSPLTASGTSLTGGTSPDVTIATGSGQSSLQISLPTSSVSDYVVMLTDQTSANLVGVTSFTIDSTTLQATLTIGGSSGDTIGVAILKKGYAGSPVTDGIIR